jgi:hypothetical protein
MIFLALIGVTVFVVGYVAIMSCWLWMDNDEHEGLKFKALKERAFREKQ